MSNYALQNRYLFRGTLEMQTALHIGGGRVSARNSDSPVILTPTGVPFIPGSSFKGSLRSTVEKFVPMLPGNLFSCALSEQDEEEYRQTQSKICSTARHQEIARAIQENPGQAEKIRAQALDDLCHTCHLFGSPLAASRVAIKDLYIPEEVWSGVLQIRDGVAIDRDSEKAKDRLKFDYEVVPASTSFALEITLENATEEDLQLISIGLSEFASGSGFIGGKRSRGLGACLLKDLHVFELDLTDPKTRNARLRGYLLERTYPKDDDGAVFLQRHLSRLFSENESKGRN